MQVCQHLLCGVEFEPQWPGQIYCKRQHMLRAREARNRARDGSQYQRRKKKLQTNKDAKREYIRLDKEARGCAHCPEKRPICLDYHHLDRTTKILAISEILRGHRPLSMLITEIVKCILLCANCHRVEEERLRLSKQQP